jgi:hypothetical protein
MVSYTKESRFYQINFANLNDVKPDDTPRLSVRELDFSKRYYALILTIDQFNKLYTKKQIYKVAL